MAVLKPSRAREVMHHAEVFDLGDVKRQAQQMLESARHEAAAIVQSAREEAERLTSGAAEAGYARGLEQGLTEGRERGQREAFEATTAEMRTRLDATIKAWNDAIERWERDRTRMLLEARRDVLDLALKLARKVVHRQIASDESIVQDQLAEALSFVARTSSLMVTINPADRELVERTMPATLAALGRAEHVTLCDDADLPRGSCVVRTEGGVVDASIGTQLDRLTESLLPGAAAKHREDAAARADADAASEDEP